MVEIFPGKLIDNMVWSSGVRSPAILSGSFEFYCLILRALFVISCWGAVWWLCCESCSSALCFCDSSEVEWSRAKDSLSGKYIDHFPYETGSLDKFYPLELISRELPSEYSVLVAFIRNKFQFWKALREGAGMKGSSSGDGQQVAPTDRGNSCLAASSQVRMAYKTCWDPA